MIPALAYTRVSGPSQVEGDGFPRQLATIRSYAQANGYEILHEYREEGITGKMELERRPALAACLEHIENNGVKVVIVECADRLARDSMISELIIRQFQKAGAKVISASGGIDLTAGDDANPTAKLVRQILAAVAEWDRCVINLKLKAGAQRKKDQTGSCGGNKPYGYMSGGNRQADIPNPKEYPTLLLIRDLKNQDKSAELISVLLNGIQMPARDGKPWRASVIRKILSRKPITNPCTAA